MTGWIDVDATPTQQRLWLVDQVSPGTAANNLAFGIDIDGPLDVKALGQALQYVVDRHDILRARFVFEADTLRVRIPSRLTVSPKVVHLAQAEDLEAERLELTRLTDRIAQAPLDTAAGCLRLALLARSPTQHRLVLVAHHAIFDGWSLPVFLGELGEGYAATTAGRPPRRTDPSHFADHVASQGRVNDADGRAFWAEALARVEGPLRLPHDFPRKSALRLRGRAHRFHVAPDLLDYARATGAAEAASAFMCGLTAFQVVLTHLTGQESFTVGTPVSDRPGPAQDYAIGPFINVLALPCDTAGDPTLRELLVRVRRSASAAYAHTHVPLQTVVDALPTRLGPRHSPAFDVVYAQHSFVAAAPALAGDLTVHTFPIDTGVAGNDLGLFVTPAADGGAEALLQYDTDVFHHETVVTIAEQFLHVLNLLGRRPDIPLSRANRPRRRLPHGTAVASAEVPASSEQRSLLRFPPAGRHEVELAWSGGVDELAQRLARLTRLDPALRCAFHGPAEQATVSAGNSDPGVVSARSAGPDRVVLSATPASVDARAVASVVSRLGTDDTTEDGSAPDDASFLGRLRGRALSGPLRQAADAAWRKALTAPPDAFATDRRGGQADEPVWRETRLPVSLGSAVAALGERHGLDPEQVLAGALALLLARHTRRSHVSVRLSTPRPDGSGPGDSAVAVVVTDPERCFDDVLGDLRQALTLAAEHSPAVLEHCSAASAADPRRHCLVAVDGWKGAPLGGSWRPAVDADLQAGLASASDGYVVSVGVRHAQGRLLGKAATEHLTHLLGELVSAPHDPLRSRFTMAAPARHAAVAAHDARSAVPARAQARSTTLSRAVADWAVRSPDAVAVLDSGGQHLTYADLVTRADRVATGLAALGVKRGDRVALAVPSGVDAVVLALGVLAAGAAFAFLDADDATTGLANRLEVLVPRYLVHAPEAPEAIASAMPARTTLAALLAPSAGTVGEPPEAIATRWTAMAEPTDLAYVAFTSGSTGRPKGVEHTHADLVEFADWQARAFPVTPRTRLSQLASLTFDVAYCEIFGALCHGATLCTRSTIALSDVAATLRWLVRDSVTVLQTIPRFLRELLVEAARSDIVVSALETVVFVGERLPGDVVAAVRAHVRPDLRLVNIYGPTETIAATWQDVTNCHHDREIPIGSAIDGRHVLLLDDHGQPCAPGATGEVWVRSAALAGRYVGPGFAEDHAASGAAYLPLPDGALGDAPPGAAAYRTGDLARLGEDGRLYFAGRSDYQVKISGIRLELESVEAAFREDASVEDCAVRLLEHGDQRQELVAFVVAPGGLDTARLHEHLRTRLARAAVPSRLVTLRELPRLTNGKVDRSALVAPDQDDDLDFEPPATSVEEAIAGAMSEVLHGAPQVGRNCDFFGLGGNSLDAVRLLNRLRGTLGVEIGLQELFAHPTVAGLAGITEAVNASSDSDVVLQRLDRRGGAPGTTEHGSSDEDQAMALLETELDDLTDDQVHQLLDRLGANEQETP